MRVPIQHKGILNACPQFIFSPPALTDPTPPPQGTGAGWWGDGGVWGKIKGGNKANHQRVVIRPPIS